MKMASHTFEQFIRFTTDSVGLERTFRLFQSVALILSSYPALLGLFISLLELGTNKPLSYSQTHNVLLSLRQRLGLARRFFRVFRFLDSFNSAHKLYTSTSFSSTSPTSTKRPFWVHAEAYLDVLGRTFNGMYLLLETSTVIDALQIDDLRVWTPEWERTMTVEAQRFWLFALLCGVVSGLLKIIKVLAYTPVPATGDVTQSEKVVGDEKVGETRKEEDQGVEGEFDIQKEQEKLRNMMRRGRKRRVLWMKEVKTKIHGLGRSVVANSFDTVLPAAVIRWIDVGQGTVGLAMFVTTILTGMEVWERCGREVGGSN